MFTYALSNPTRTLRGKIKNIALVFGLHLIWYFIVHLLNAYVNEFPFNLHRGFDPDQETKRQAIFYGCVYAPLTEELIFRFAPILLIRHLAKTYGSQIVLPLIIITSAIFGLQHDNSLNLLIQGVGGFMYSWLCIKNQDYLSSVIAHSSWNVMEIFIAGI